MDKIAAALIVRNEAAVLRRCLTSLRKAGIQHIVVNDNGSTDDTPQILEEFDCIQVPGPWVDYSSNRNLVLAVARKWGDYVLCGIDADEELVVPENFQWPMHGVDIYQIQLQLGGLQYPRRALVKSTAPIEWRYVLHEILMPITGTCSVLDLPGPYIVSHADGHRAKNKDTQQRDLDVLIKAMHDYPLEPRYVFYTAQTFKDINALNFAKTYYQKRLEMGGYYDERWYSQYMLARIADWQGENPVMAYLEAYNINAYRAEPLYYAADWLRRNNKPIAAYAIASIFKKPTPFSGLFVESAIYLWQLPDIIAATAWYADEKAHGASASHELLMRGAFPENQRARIEGNAKLYGIVQ